jgi:hypothetical protein
MTADAADKAHDNKVKETADGERLVEHSTFHPGDRELREVQDAAEVERVGAYKEAGYVAAPGVGDYHAVRREAKHMNAALVVAAGGGTAEDPSAVVVDGVRSMVQDASQEAAKARRAASKGRGAGPAQRQGRHEVMQGGTGGLVQGTAEGSGKSASSSGTDTTDQGMNATVGSAPANLDPGVENTPQDRPKSQADSPSPSGAGKAPGSSGSTGSTKPTKPSGNRAN